MSQIIIMNMSSKKVMWSGVLGIALLMVSSCKTPSNISYFQDFYNNPDTVVNLQNKVITIKPTDKLYRREEQGSADFAALQSGWR